MSGVVLEHSGGGAAGTPWTTIYDLDFSAQANLALPTDGNYTIGGLTWTKAHTNRDGTPTMVIQNGQGLVVNAGYGLWNSSSHQCVSLQLPLSQLAIPNWDWDTKLRIWVYIPAITCTQANSAAVFALGFLESFTVQPANDYVAFYGMDQYQSSTGLFLQHYMSQADLTATTKFDLATHRVAMMESACVDENMHCRYGDFGGTGPWPSSASLFLGNTAQLPDSGAQNRGANGTPPAQGPLSNMALILGAQAQNSTTVATFGRVRVDYRS